jgi:hypothetical protein
MLAVFSDFAQLSCICQIISHYSIVLYGHIPKYCTFSGNFKHYRPSHEKNRLTYIYVFIRKFLFHNKCTVQIQIF